MSGSPGTPAATASDLVRIHEMYGDEFLGQLLGVSMSSVRRYRTGARPVPDAVAARIHFLFLVTDALAGSYNDAGLRRWWERPRTALEGRSPLDALGAGSAATVRAAWSCGSHQHRHRGGVLGRKRTQDSKGQ